MGFGDEKGGDEQVTLGGTSSLVWAGSLVRCALTVVPLLKRAHCPENTEFDFARTEALAGCSRPLSTGLGGRPLHAVSGFFAACRVGGRTSLWQRWVDDYRHSTSNKGVGARICITESNVSASSRASHEKKMDTNIPSSLRLLTWTDDLRGFNRISPSFLRIVAVGR